MRRPPEPRGAGPGPGTRGRRTAAAGPGRLLLLLPAAPSGAGPRAPCRPHRRPSPAAEGACAALSDSAAALRQAPARRAGPPRHGTRGTPAGPYRWAGHGAEPPPVPGRGVLPGPGSLRARGRRRRLTDTTTWRPQGLLPPPPAGRGLARAAPAPRPEGRGGQGRGGDGRGAGLARAALGGPRSPGIRGSRNRGVTKSRRHQGS